MSKQKARGTAAETAVVNYLSQFFPNVERRTLSGAHDKGDINLHPNVVIEVKDHQRMALSEWVDEADKEGTNASAWIAAVWHKRMRKGNPAEWYVTMKGDVFAGLLKVYFDLLEADKQVELMAKHLGIVEES